MAETETVQVPKSVWETFTAWLKHTTEPEPTKPPEIPEEFKTAVTERDELKAQIQKMEADKTQAARVEAFAAQLRETKVTEGAGMLAAMSEEQAAWVITQFKALSKQIDESALLGEKGSNQSGATDTVTAVNAAIQAKAAELKINPYPDAFEIVRRERPELFK